MNSIVEKLEQLGQENRLYHLQGCSAEQIAQAQEALQIIFPEEFVDYAKKYGAVSFYATEWMGLNVPEALDVVRATKAERTQNPDFPADCFVLENLGIDGIIAAVDQKGKVYAVHYEQKKLLCNSMTEYLEVCIARNKS
jgi:hypothetical protein